MDGVDVWCAAQVSSELEALKRRLRDRAAELDRLCCLQRGPIDDQERHTLLRRLEGLEQANAREKRQLEDQLSKVTATASPVADTKSRAPLTCAPVVWRVADHPEPGRADEPAAAGVLVAAAALAPAAHHLPPHV